MVKKIFMPHDVEEILKIRLPIFDQKDFISLTPDKHGLFTIRGMHNFALDLKNNTPPNPSGNAK
jgi:hypothetical protein